MIRTVEQKPIIYREYWVARVIRDCGSSKVVYKEKFFDTNPTEQDIVDILLKSPKDCFISLAHNYRLLEGV